MARLAISRGFLEEYSKLQHATRARVQRATDLFAKHTAQELRELKGLHLERHKHSADSRARTVRFGDNHRGIIFDTGDDEHFVLTMVGTHEETDRWMANNKFTVNAATGALEVVDVVAIQREAAVVHEVTAGSLLFAHRKDKDFIQLGIERDLVPVLRVLTSEEQALGIAIVLPPAQAEALLGLTGDETVEEIYAAIAGRLPTEPVDVEDVVSALAAPATRGSFHIVEDQDELAEMLAQPLVQWRIFLHHSQYEMANKEIYNGPVRITGGAGTGKTVVALHRTKALSRQLSDRNGKPILFTTYTRNLAKAIEQDLRVLGGTELLDVTDVINVDRVAYKLVQTAEGSQPRIASDVECRELWDNVIDEQGLSYSSFFLMSEWEQVVLAQDLVSRAAYFSASRAGRGVALDRRKRASVWKAIEIFTKKLADSGARTHLQIATAAAGYVAVQSVKPYQHVVVDEAQDLHEAQWRLLRAIVEEGPNDLFLVGDSHQRIYDRHSSLSKVGINIRGRSKKLRINYRTTHEILAWSLALLGEGDFDDLDDGVDDQDFAGYHSYRRGSTPTMSGHASKKQQFDALASQVRTWIDDGVDPEAIGVAGRAHASFDAVDAALERAQISTCRLPQRDLPNTKGVRVGTMHRMKGLEFERVAIVDADDRTIPAPYALCDPDEDQVQHASDLTRERCVLYVAATRARDGLWVGWSGKPSRFLGPVLGD